MKKILLPFIIVAMCAIGLPAFAQEKVDSVAELGLAGDNLDLYAVVDLFLQSKTIEGFEKSLNEDSKNRINNLDLNLDKKVDFIKVITKKDGDAYSFTLRVDVSKTESQDVAIIMLSKDKSGNMSLQCVGDPDLYGKDYIIEPKGNSSVTANPAYKGPDPVTVNVPAQTTVVVQQAPVVQYVYSPAYVPYTPPYYYGYYPGWWGFATVMAVGIYRSNHWYHHGGYYGGHYHGGHNNVVINTGNRNTINHYNNNRRTSNTVTNNQRNGNYGNGRTDRSRGGQTAGTRPTTNDRGGNRGGGSDRPSAGTADRGGNRGGSDRASASTRPSTSDRSGNAGSNRATPSTSNRSSGGFSGSSSYGGGGRSMGGGSRGGGGGGRRR